MNRFVAIFLLIGSLGAIGGCDAISGKSDDGGGSAPDLKNTEWFGPMESGGIMYRLKITFDSDGNISEIERDEIPLGLTGEVIHEEGDIFSFVLNDGTLGGFMVLGGHAAFLTELQDIGALEQNASVLSNSYTLSDIAGTWSGYTILLDDSFSLVDVFDSEVTVQSSGAFEGSSDDGTIFQSSLSLSVTESLYGRYYGQSQDGGECEPCNVDVYLTPDKQFAGSQAQWGAFPGEYTFNAWEMQ